MPHEVGATSHGYSQQSVARLLHERERLRHLARVDSPGTGVGWRDARRCRRDRVRHLAVPLKSEVGRDAPEFGLRLIEEFFEGSHGPAVARKSFQCVERGLANRCPLRRAHRCQRSANQPLPAVDQRERPRVSPPAREAALRHEPTALPGHHRRADGQQWATHHEDEPRLGVVFRD